MDAHVVVVIVIFSYRTWCELALKGSPLEHCISRPVPPQHPHSLLWPHCVCSADPGQQSKQQSARLWSSTLTSLPDTTASKPTTTSFSPRGYTNTPEQVTRTLFYLSLCFLTFYIFSVSELFCSTLSRPTTIVPLGIQQHFTGAVPLKGQLCTL